MSEIKLEYLKEMQRRRRARVDLLEYTKYVWWHTSPLIVGEHTRGIAARLTRAVDDFLQGKSTFLMIEVPFRHGKSDLVSRSFPGFFLGRCASAQPDVILSGYGATLVESFSRRVKAIVRSNPYRTLYPDVKLSKAKASASEWAIDGSSGEVVAAGLCGAITGRGGHLVVIDDYCKSRKEAESLTYRDSVWDSFTNDLMTRRAPVSIVVVCATRWHCDDMMARIEKKMAEDPEFPRFERISYPARGKRYASGYLFPERFPEAWYREQYATLGTYGAAALLDCHPVVRGGALFKTDHVVIHEDTNAYPKCQYVRAWDLASTKKERNKDDPDWTVGALIGRMKPGLVPELWIRDVCRGQWEAPERNKRIIACANRDGPAVKILSESVGGYKDTYTTLQTLLRGMRSVIGVSVSADKMVRAAPLEPLFEAGTVHVTRAIWEQIGAEFAEFPNAAHDDIVDAISLGWTWLAAGGAKPSAPPQSGQKRLSVMAT